MKRFISLLINLIVIAALISPASAMAAPPPPTPEPPPIDPLQRQAIEQAVDTAVQAEKPGKLYFMIYDIKVDRIELTADKTTGLAWLVPVDPNSGAIIATEPAVAVINQPAPGDKWQVTLPTDKNYESSLASLPPSLASPELSKNFPTEKSITPKITQAFTGYYLPWEGGKGKILSGSIGHFLIYYSCSITACRYAYDFYDGTRFPLEASKGGTVWAYFDGWPNDDHTSGHTNYIVLRDPTTSPVTYQLYYHLEQGTIPAELKHVGALVNQGDFIGNVDNTGYSTGNHIHFMVYADPTTPGSSWGNSVDIIFNEVTVNGGRPRTQYEATTYPGYGTGYMPGNVYVSNNRRTVPPSGELTAPAGWTQVTGPTVNISGRGINGDWPVANTQVVADYNGTWTPITPMMTSNPFSINVDLCAANVPDGPLTLALYVWDNKGNRSLLPQTPRPIVKNYVCSAPPPPCNPTAEQVAIYSGLNYQGTCSLYNNSDGISNSGIYDTARLGALADNTAASIQVGANMMVTVFDGNYSNGGFNGRAETFDASDAGLGDNRIGIGRISSLIVRHAKPPTAPRLINPPKTRTDLGANTTDSLVLTWIGDEGGVDYQVELTYPDSSKYYSPWMRGTAWSVGSLPAGDYSWKVTTNNRSGSAVSNIATFNVADAGLPTPPTMSFPYADSMQNGVNNWVAAGLWRQTNSTASSENVSNIFWVANQSSDGTYASSTVYASDLTSPPISIPQGTSAYLRFREYNQTESPEAFWDERQVQISVNGGAFSDLYQMHDDPTDWWVYSPYLNLSAYAGKTVRVRFHFDQVDSYYNNFSGWRIDDVTISSSAPDLANAESSPNDSTATATPLTMNSTTQGYICPAGDLDYYSFSVTAGATVTFDIDAQSQNPASGLDTYIFLIDSDGKSVIAENDDEVSWQVRDSYLRYTFNREGTYYLKVKSWSYPGSSVSSYVCSSFFYTLKVNGDSHAPFINISSPIGGWIGPRSIDVTAQVNDPGSGIEQIDFLWHSPDWTNDAWLLLGSDTNGSDGWKAAFNPAGKTIEGSTLVARATTVGKLTSSTWITPLHYDTAAPTTRLIALPATINSTVIPLTWNASDAGSGIDYLQIQYQDNGGAWQLWNTTFAGDVRSAYFQGQGGHTYGFTIHGIDNVGNVESYSPTAETSTTIAAACTPDGEDAIAPSDSSSGNASLLPLNVPQEHNFCPSGDEDWVSFTVPAAGEYLARVIPVSGGAAATLYVTTSDGQTVLIHGHSLGLGKGVDLKFIAPAAGTYKLRATPLNSGLWGTDMRYDLWIGNGFWQYFTVIKK